MGIVRVGFFRELDHGRPDGPSIHDSIGRKDPDEANIFRYLIEGETLAATGSMVDDYFDKRKTRISPLEIATDGRWVWPRDLAYYVANYHVCLPPEFIGYMRDCGWEVPRLTKEEMESVEEEFFMSS